jgi:hypothetical protein
MQARAERTGFNSVDEWAAAEYEAGRLAYPFNIADAFDVVDDPLRPASLVTIATFPRTDGAKDGM